MNKTLNEIIKTIDEIILNERKESIDTIGSYIVGATIVREDYELFQNKYPLLGEIAELGADLETLKGSEAKAVLEDIKSKLSLLKEQVADK